MPTIIEEKYTVLASDSLEHQNNKDFFAIRFPENDPLGYAWTFNDDNNTIILIRTTPNWIKPQISNPE